MDGGTTVVEEKEIKEGRKEDACCVSGMENKQMGKEEEEGEGQEKEGRGRQVYIDSLVHPVNNV